MTQTSAPTTGRIGCDRRALSAARVVYPLGRSTHLSTIHCVQTVTVGEQAGSILRTPFRSTTQAWMLNTEESNLRVQVISCPTSEVWPVLPLNWALSEGAYWTPARKMLPPPVSFSVLLWLSSHAVGSGSCTWQLRSGLTRMDIGGNIF